MSNAWYLIVIVGIVVAAVLLLRSRSNRSGPRAEHQSARRELALDHVQDRETSRLAHMSAEDRDWEQASLQRNRDNEARKDAPAQVTL